jgi:hypothetical protein
VSNVQLTSPPSEMAGVGIAAELARAVQAYGCRCETGVGPQLEHFPRTEPLRSERDFWLFFSE